MEWGSRHRSECLQRTWRGVKWLAVMGLLVVGCQTSVTLPSQAESDVQADATQEPGPDAGPGALEPDAVEDSGGSPASDSMTGATGDAPQGDSTGATGDAQRTHNPDTTAPDGTPADGSPADGIPCESDCSDKVCGDDGCGGSCGLCPTLWSCQDGACVEEECVPLCGGLECGFDGCGGVCGFCPPGELCAEGLCEIECTCDGKECGDNGCGVDCGACDPLYSCVENQCEILEGTWSCTEILGCQDLCPPEASLCLEACVQGGDTLGQYEYQLYATCIENHGCTDKLCIAEHCSSQIAVCEYEENGALTCAEIITCQNLCDPWDQSCIDACIPLGSVAAQAEYISLVYCLQYFCPLGSLPDCVNFSLADATLCADYYQACLAP